MGVMRRCRWCRRVQVGDAWLVLHPVAGDILETVDALCPTCGVAQRLSDLSRSFESVAEASRRAQDVLEDFSDQFPAPLYRLRLSVLPWTPAMWGRA